MSKIGDWEACDNPFTPGMACYRRSLGEGQACVFVDEDGCADYDKGGARAWNLFPFGSQEPAGGIANAMARADAVLVAAGLLDPARALTVASAEALTAAPPVAPDAWGDWEREVRQQTSTVTFPVGGKCYDVVCYVGDSRSIIEANLRCAVAARKASETTASVNADRVVVIWSPRVEPAEKTFKRSEKMPALTTELVDTWRAEPKIGEWSDWRRYVGGSWDRREKAFSGDYVHVNDNTEPGVFRVLACGTLLGERFTCPDAAREAADAYLVSQGRLPASRAFVRLGEWEPDTEHGHGYMVRRQTGGQSPLSYWACREVDRAESDARAVANGWLDPSRAFKAPTSIHSAVALAPPPRAHAMTARAAMKETEEAFRKAVTHAINQPAKPTWGEWERHATDPVYNRFASGRSMWALSGLWNLMNGEAGGYATDIDDAREKADAYLVARGELEAERAFKRVGDWTEGAGNGEVVRLARQDGEWCVATARSNRWTMWPREIGEMLASGEFGGDAGKAAADAELVRRGLLAEERAFKVASTVCVDSAQGGDYGGVVQISKKATGVFEVAASHTLPVRLNAHTVSVEVAIWGLMLTAAGKELDRAAAELNLRRNGEETDEAFRARCGERLRGAAYGSWADASPWPALGPGETITIPRPITEHTEVTITNWEHHLPTLLANAPREFRDGFNRRQGPAWEAYIVALAGVRERIQCKRFPGGATVGAAIEWATLDARDTLGAEWVKANVR